MRTRYGQYVIPPVSIEVLYGNFLRWPVVQMFFFFILSRREIPVVVRDFVIMKLCWPNIGTQRPRAHSGKKFAEEIAVAICSHCCSALMSSRRHQQTHLGTRLRSTLKRCFTSERTLHRFEVRGGNISTSGGVQKHVLSIKKIQNLIVRSTRWFKTSLLATSSTHFGKGYSYIL